MKKKTLANVLKKVITVLVIILVSLVSFLGIHKKELNSWKNILPEYELSKELSDIRVFGFTVDDSTEKVEDESNVEEKNTEEDSATTEENTEENSSEENTENVEENSEESTSESTENSEETTKETPVNDPKNLTKENYKKTKKIVEERLKKFGMTDAEVSVDENTGDLSVSVPYEDITDYTVSLAGNEGTIEIVDTETQEVLISKNMIKNVTTNYQPSDSESTSEYTYNIGIIITLKSDGQKKLNEMTKKYIETIDENGEATQKTVTVKIDGDNKYTTYFSPDGQYTQLFVPIYQNVSTKDMKDFNDKYNECAVIQTEANTETLPIKYKLSSGTFIKSSLSEKQLQYIVIAGIAIIAIIGIIIIIKNKITGILSVIIEIGFIAIHLLLIRAAGVSLTLSGLVMILFMALLNYALLISLSNQEKNIEKLEAFGNFILAIIPFIITIIAFVLSKNIHLQSVGMVGIWAIFVLAYTLISSMLLLNTKKNGVE